MIVYKVRDKKTGEFSTGGHFPRFNKRGKTWSRVADVTAHLNHAADQMNRTIYHQYKTREVEVVEFELTEKESGVVPLREWVRAAALRKAERDAEFQRKREDYQKQLRRAEYERLKKEFETLHQEFHNG